MMLQNTEEIWEMCIWLALINSVVSYPRERRKNQLPDKIHRILLGLDLLDFPKYRKVQFLKVFIAYLIP